MRPFLFAFAGFLATATLGISQPLLTTLVAPPGSVSSGTTIVLDVVALNRGSAAAAFTSPAELAGTLTIGARSWPLALQAETTAPADILPGAFAATRYRLMLPAGAVGRGVIDVATAPAQRLSAVIDLSSAVNAPSGPLLGAGAETAFNGAIPSAEVEASLLGRTFAGRLAAHEPVYFIYGNETQAAKFQLSFKYKLASFGQPSPCHVPSSLQFSYTQRSLWDIDGTSSPFYDTSYMPEFFWEWLKIPVGNDAALFTWSGFQLGGKHESNGRDGLDSRSLNIAFVRTVFTIGPANGWRLVLVPEIWDYAGGLSDNEDIDEYRGHGQLRGIFGKADGPMLSFTGMAGKDFDHGSLQLDLTVPLHTRFLDLSMFFLVQYFHGYGESLRSYDLKSESLRAGFSLIR